ncbi:ArnT family glycosyltransferase [Sandaracinus amylolyticus]|uniref:Polymyxin resistance protein ArnT, undecaprenyl phosphate-alpha-L-Ara4N transferase n=1 Tax=Sandaracinus amylolyticus TaxID=927083 RepID=A0A0F6WAW0_9BACT|nr:glycosyltransferase family 39 protein [Sandaracinus amylolyticus]AKF11777.1 Polymyxin resistance protein ArnT, undecaprenyl phosphate-alpha-L-Ara4N transferase [Sandaracinus amylolyticus]
MSERDEEAGSSSTGDGPKGRKSSQKTGAEPAKPASSGGASHRVRGGAIFGVGIIATFALMAFHEQVSHGALVGMITTLVATLGLLDLLGLFAPRSEPGAIAWRDTALWARAGEPIFLAPVITVPLAIAIAVLGAMVGGVDALPIVIVAALVPLALSALRRPAMLVFVLGAAIVLPFLGAYGLWDPWETHYGEVAREILARDDWISLWWAQEDWFWSKPIFIFWIEALSMSALGVDFQPDANPAHPEWALRLPHFLLTMGALLAIYAVVARGFGRRAGVVAAFVLATMPYFFFLAHQAITDMPFVSTMTMAMGMLGLAIATPADREVTRYRLGSLEVSGQHALIGALAMTCIPQIMLLITRNVTLVTGGFAWHRDRFMFGSAGNAGNPGNAEAREVAPAFDGILAQPFVQGLLWLAGFAAVVWLLRNERRARSLLMVAFYFFCALSFMAKGIPGFALPGMVALFWLIATRRWDLLLEGQLRVAAGILVVATVGLPWYVAMYIRHGQGFTDRLLVHDHINRLTSGVHGDTGSAEYFLEQLGYGLFPWVALAPLAIAGWVVIAGRTRESERAPATVSASTQRVADELEMPLQPPAPTTAPKVATGLLVDAQLQRELLAFIGLWGTGAFVLFSGMTTKFHHYIFPAVPAAGALVGIAVDALFGPRSDLERFDAKKIAGTVLAAVASLPIVIGVAGMWGDVRGVVPEDVPANRMRDWVLRHPWFGEHTIPLVLLGVALAAAAWWLLRDEPRDRIAEDGETPRWAPSAATAGLFAAPAILAMVGRDLSWVTSARPHGYERLIHLFVYNYQRAWPEHFDYRPILTGFAITAGVVIGVAALPIVRQVALRAFLGVAFFFAVWCLDVYLIDLSPHWGQRELVRAYYEQRRSADEPLIAWQMNWKGENFYTGNAVYAFVDLDNRRLNEWVRAHPGQRVYFVLEHQRLANLRSVLRGATIEEVTDERLDNKFVLVSADLPGAAGPVRDRARD